MLDLGSAAPPELLGIAVLREAYGIPEAQRRLHAKLALEGAERGSGVELPVTPCSAGQAVLEKHADDRHHGQTTVRDLGVELGLPGLGTGHGGSSVGHAQGARVREISGSSVILLREVASLDEAREQECLSPTSSGDLGESGQA